MAGVPAAVAGDARRGRSTAESRSLVVLPSADDGVTEETCTRQQGLLQQLYRDNNRQQQPVKPYHNYTIS